MTMQLETPLTFNELIKYSVLNWYACFRRGWVWALAMIVLSSAYQLSHLGLPAWRPFSSLQLWFAGLLLVLILLILGFLQSVRSTSQPVVPSNARVLVHLLKRLPRVLLGLILLLLIVFLMSFLGVWIGAGVAKHLPMSPLLYMFRFLLAGFPPIYFFLLSLYALPLLLFEKIGVWRAFARSIKLTYFFWFKVFLSYAIISLFALLSFYIYRTAGAAWGLHELLIILIAALFVLVVLPWWVSVTDLLYQDLCLRSRTD